MRICTQKRSCSDQTLTCPDACCNNDIQEKKKHMRSDIGQHRPDVKAIRVWTQKKVCSDVSHRKAEARGKFAEKYSS
jgi:hypothetical protein